MIRSLALLPMLLLLGACGGDRSASWTEAPEAADLVRVMEIAHTAYEKVEASAEPHRLVGVKQIVTPEGYVWRATYKLASLLPEDPSEGLVGAGGEVFVNVDPTTGKAEIRYGE